MNDLAQRLTSIANSEDFRARARRFQEAHKSLPKSTNTAQSSIERVEDDGSDGKGPKSGRNHGIDELEGAQRQTEAADDISDASPQSNMVTISRGAHGSHGEVNGKNEALKFRDGNRTVHGGERLQVGWQFQSILRSAQDSEDRHSQCQTQVKTEVRAGVKGGARQASDIVQRGRGRGHGHGHGMHPRERSGGNVEEEEAVEEGNGTKGRRWKKVKRVVAGMDSRNQGPDPSPYANLSLPPPRLLPYSSILTRQHQPLNVHKAHEVHEAHEAWHANEVEDYRLNPFTWNKNNINRRLPAPDVAMSLDGHGRTARGPRGKGKNQHPSAQPRVP